MKKTIKVKTDANDRLSSIHINGIRVGQCLRGPANNIGYQLQFRSQGCKFFRGFSFETWDTKEECQQALDNHIHGTSIYKPYDTFYGGKYFICKAYENE